jgi:hypothetical protein
LIFTKLTKEDLGWLWMALSDAFGNKFTNTYGSKVNNIWFHGLKHLTVADLRFGFRRMLDHISDHERESGEAWPPNLKEFRMFCEKRPEDFQLPSAGKAFREVENNYYLKNKVWSHPIVAQSAVSISERAENRAQAYQQFKLKYDALCEAHMHDVVMGAQYE